MCVTRISGIAEITKALFRDAEQCALRRHPRRGSAAAMRLGAIKLDRRSR
jgi:hypothetical protein